MSVVYINRSGDTYYLHQGITKKGNPKYYFSRNDDGILVDSIPEGYEIYENPNARVFLRRISPRIFTEEEITIAQNNVKKRSALKDFKIDIRRKAIVVFEPDQDIDALTAIISAFPGRDSAETEEILREFLTYSPTMRFVLEDAKQREFRVERMCYIGPEADWLFLSTGDLKTLAKQFCYHLGRESFYELM